MCIKSNTKVLQGLIDIGDHDKVEHFLLYSDCRDEMIKKLISIYGHQKILEVSRKFKGVVLKQKVEQIYQNYDTECKMYDMNLLQYRFDNIKLEIK